MKENWWKAAGPMAAARMDKKFYRKEEASRGCTPGAAQTVLLYTEKQTGVPWLECTWFQELNLILLIVLRCPPKLSRTFIFSSGPTFLDDEFLRYSHQSVAISLLRTKLPSLGSGCLIRTRHGDEALGEDKWLLPQIQSFLIQKDRK